MEEKEPTKETAQQQPTTLQPEENEEVKAKVE